jgi:hypothetical protein
MQALSLKDQKEYNNELARWQIATGNAPGLFDICNICGTRRFYRPLSEFRQEPALVPLLACNKCDNTFYQKRNDEEFEKLDWTALKKYLLEVNKCQSPT